MGGALSHHRGINAHLSVLKLTTRVTGPAPWVLRLEEANLLRCVGLLFLVAQLP